ncbi:DUF5133 domain-containing protein [Streptomyces sp. SID14478]|uniref:DUF5133 domain-containing protein n=1 Tax=Streptomyces sp. SID14478 TaxID=2706073 RepID=UPI0013DD062C|nr:DUF5133 domain-containing protein [Streptomyces sp. SID14478]NEB77373.1 DUF5133 domain-containing protein [Streptomyces sp. SID14478]
MLMLRAETIRALVSRYEELRARDGGATQELEDVSYTLCVSTGTRTVQDALHRAEEIQRRSLALTA